MKQITRKLLLYLVILVFTSVSTVSPALSFSIGEERELGEKLLYSVRSSFELIDDPDITQYLTRLGHSVLEVAGVQYFDYHFFVINNKEFNAFAAPSGLIFFHSGLIGSMNSEDELVSVLAHEIGHIVKRHLASRVEKGKYTSMASLGLALAAVAFGGAATPALLTGALATGQSMNLHFSRTHEEEADLLAYGWMREMGRNPEGQANMLETMRRIARYRSEKLPQYLLTHPNPEDRLHTVQSLIDIDASETTQDFDEDEDFDFLRFKYRILSKVKEGKTFKAYLASILSNSRTSDFRKTMASYGLARVAVSENNYDRGRSLLAEVRERFPQKDILLADQGEVELGAGNIDKAESLLRQALKNDTSEMYPTFLLAQLLLRTKRYDEAEKYFKTVSYELPEYAQVYFELGQIASYQKKHGLANFYLGKNNLYKGKLKLAVASLKSALRDSSLPKEEKVETEKLLAKIKKLKGKS